MAIAAVISHVHGALERLGSDCPMEDVPSLCPELTWNQVFLAIDYLSRTGQICVTLDAGRTYRVKATRAATAEPSCVSACP
ncbi:MAG: hypothetical protein OEY21_07990 [Nitrospira sp.]|nr:hypothetical protein [Nitrospira sp.]